MGTTRHQIVPPYEF